MQIIADVTGRPVLGSDVDAEASLGAAMLAALGTGVVADAAALRGWVRLVERARPDAAAHARYGAMFTQYVAAYPGAQARHARAARLSLQRLSEASIHGRLPHTPAVPDDQFEGTIGTTWQESTPWWPAAKRPRPGAPNVVVVLYDDVGFGSFGCYGAEIATPTMDALADQGVRYNNFHVTPLCSPTRASLLTGRNHHSVGMAFLANADSGFPGPRGHVTKQAATLAEILRRPATTRCASASGISRRSTRRAPPGPYDQWPLGRGFERFYGFLDALTDHFYPDLVHDNHRVDPPKTPEQGYHLTEDLIDHAIGFVRDQVSASGDKPFFTYIAFGAAHCPHQAPPAFLEKYRGAYDEGWDVIRERRYRRQLELGIIPRRHRAGAAQRDASSRGTASRPTRRRSRRGCRRRSRRWSTTPTTSSAASSTTSRRSASSTTPSSSCMADNGASQEGGPGGSTNIVAYENGNQPDLAFNLARLEQIGGPRSQTNYPHGWAQVGNTPLRRYKQNTHAGGVRAPLIVSWPAGLPARGEIRGQFHHVIDIVPTMLDLVGVAAPQVHQGVPQLPIHGVSLRYSFDDAAAPTRRATQYFEMFTHRALWHDGWKAVVVSSPRQHLRPGRLGALQPRRGFLRVQRPRGAAPRAAAEDDRPLVGRGRPVRRAAARRPRLSGARGQVPEPRLAAPAQPPGALSRHEPHPERRRAADDRPLVPHRRAARRHRCCARGRRSSRSAT